MKYPKMTQQIELLLLKKTRSGEEIRVFMAWQNDSLEYQSTVSIISERTGMSKQNIYRAFSGLVDKNILEIAGYKNNPTGKKSKIYELTRVFCEEAVENYERKRNPIKNNMDICFEERSKGLSPAIIAKEAEIKKVSLNGVVPNKKFDQDVLDMFGLSSDDLSGE